MCSMAKSRCMKDGEKTLEGRCEDMWERCGAELKAHKKQEAQNGAMERKDDRADSWSMCSMAKTRCMKDGRKILDGHCGDVWERCGSEFKAHNEQEAKSSAMEKKEDLVDLKSNPHRMWPMCSMAKNRCMKDGEKTLE